MINIKRVLWMSFWLFILVAGWSVSGAANSDIAVDLVMRGIAGAS